MGASSTTSRTRRKCIQFSIAASSLSACRSLKGTNMSVQFGRWNFNGQPVSRDYLEKVESVIAPYGPDDEGACTNSNIHILYRALHTTKESRRETQPYILASGAVLAWDGRLDNREELV